MKHITRNLSWLCCIAVGFYAIGCGSEKDKEVADHYLVVLTKDIVEIAYAVDSTKHNLWVRFSWRHYYR